MIDDIIRGFIDDKVAWYRGWLKEYPYDFQRNCSREYLIDSITTEITDSVTDKNFTIAELKDAISESIDSFDFQEVIDGRTYSFTKPVMV